jgi:DHA1 family inner membrane transport protein
VVSSYSLAYALSAPVLAALTSRMKKERLVVWTLAGFALANALCALAPSYPALVASRVLAGIAAGLYSPTAYALAASLARPDRKASALSAVALGITGSVLAGVPIGVLVGNGFGWHASFWLIGGLSIVALVALRACPLPAANGASAVRSSLSARLAPLVRGRTLLALLPSILMSAGIMSTYTYLGAMLRERSFGAHAIALFYVLVGLGGVVGTLAGGRLVDRFGPTAMLTILFLAGVLDTALFHTALGHTGALIAACVPLHFTFAACILGQQRRLIGLDARHTDVVLALNNSCLYGGLALGASVGGAMLAHGFALGSIPFASSLLLLAALTVYSTSLFVEARAERARLHVIAIPSLATHTSE